VNPTATALRAGMSRGLIEWRQSFTGTALIGQLFWPAVTLAAIFFFRDKHVGATRFTLGAFILPSVLGMFTAFGMLLVIQYLAAEREDGTHAAARQGHPGRDTRLFHRQARHRVGDRPGVSGDPANRRPVHRRRPPRRQHRFLAHPGLGAGTGAGGDPVGGYRGVADDHGHVYGGAYAGDGLEGGAELCWRVLGGDLLSGGLLLFLVVLGRVDP
jgi:hypothetical protein